MLSVDGNGGEEEASDDEKEGAAAKTGIIRRDERGT